MKNTILLLSLAAPLLSTACRTDKDGDGHDSLIFNGEDCDDTNPTINPFASDLLGDGIDQNCDGIDGTDADGDGHASIASGGDDCDDHWSDFTGKVLYYIDNDKDGFGDRAQSVEACTPPFGYVDNKTDCDDNDHLVNPDAAEICDLIDNDCDELIDDDDSADLDPANPISGQVQLYLDLDQDGFGTDEDTTFACFPDNDYSAADGDCDDSDPDINPEAFDVPGDSIDQDCNGIDGIPDLMYGDLILPDDRALEMFCNSFDSIYGDIELDLNQLTTNSTEILSCLTAIYGDLTIRNINETATISFENLYQVETLTLEGGRVYNFPNLIHADNINISFNDPAIYDEDIEENIPVFDGDDHFPVLETISGVFSWSNGLGEPVLIDAENPEDPQIEIRADIIGFSNLQELGGLHIFDDVNLGDVTGFPNITELKSLTIEDTFMDNLSGFNLSSVNMLNLLDNYVLYDTPALQNLSSTSLLQVLGNASLAADACLYYTLDTNIDLSQVVTPTLNFGNCDIDGDGSLNAVDCDDQDASLHPSDVDQDNYTPCTGDCNDNDPSINPLANEIWYDGVDQNCDGANDYDADGDKDLVEAIDCSGTGQDLDTECDFDNDGIIDWVGGSDCNDYDGSVHGYDLDGDGKTYCVPDPNAAPEDAEEDEEVVTSCRTWANAGATIDGNYPLLFPNGSSFEVYCDMTTDGGGWTLFAVTNASACAEDLPYGEDLTKLVADETTESQPPTEPYFSTLLENTLFSQFLQDVRGDGERTDYTIIWNFLDGSDFMENRFLYAYGYGIGVQWDVNFRGSQYSYVGGWRFSNSAFYNWTQHPWQQEEGTNFSNDDGIWGAADGEVNGNFEIPPAWGHGVVGASDVASDNVGDCSGVYFDGTEYQSENLVNLLYFR